MSANTNAQCAVEVENWKMASSVPDYDRFTDDPDNGPFYGAWCIVWSMPFSCGLRLASGFADQEEAEAEAERRRENHNQIVWRVCSCDELTGLDQVR